MIITEEAESNRNGSGVSPVDSPSLAASDGLEEKVTRSTGGLFEAIKRFFANLFRCCFLCFISKEPTSESPRVAHVANGVLGLSSFEKALEAVKKKDMNSEDPVAREVKAKMIEFLENLPDGVKNDPRISIWVHIAPYYPFVDAAKLPDACKKDFHAITAECDGNFIQKLDILKAVQGETISVINLYTEFVNVFVRAIERDRRFVERYAYHLDPENTNACDLASIKNKLGCEGLNRLVQLNRCYQVIDWITKNNAEDVNLAMYLIDPKLALDLLDLEKKCQWISQAKAFFPDLEKRIKEWNFEKDATRHKFYNLYRAAIALLKDVEIPSEKLTSEKLTPAIERVAEKVLTIRHGSPEDFIPLFFEDELREELGVGLKKKDGVSEKDRPFYLRAKMYLNTQVMLTSDNFNEWIKTINTIAAKANEGPSTLTSEWITRKQKNAEEMNLAMYLIDPKSKLDLNELDEKYQWISKAKAAFPDFEERIKDWDFEKDATRHKFYNLYRAAINLLNYDDSIYAIERLMCAIERVGESVLKIRHGSPEDFIPLFFEDELREELGLRLKKKDGVSEDDRLSYLRAKMYLNTQEMLTSDNFDDWVKTIEDTALKPKKGSSPIRSILGFS